MTKIKRNRREGKDSVEGGTVWRKGRTWWREGMDDVEGRTVVRRDLRSPF